MSGCKAKGVSEVRLLAAVNVLMSDRKVVNRLLLYVWQAHELRELISDTFDEGQFQRSIWRIECDVCDELVM